MHIWLDSQEDDLGRAWHVQVLALDVGSVGSIVRGGARHLRLNQAPLSTGCLALGGTLYLSVLASSARKPGLTIISTPKDAVVLSEVMTGQSVP